MADVYRQKVGSLCSALESEESRTGAVDAIRALVETIVLEPDGEYLKITLNGDLAGMLNAASDSKRSPDTGDLLLQIKLVAGGRSANQRTLVSFVAESRPQAWFGVEGLPESEGLCARKKRRQRGPRKPHQTCGLTRSYPGTRSGPWCLIWDADTASDPAGDTVCDFVSVGGRAG